MSEVIPLIFGVFKNKIERRGRQNKNNRPINLPKVIKFLKRMNDLRLVAAFVTKTVSCLANCIFVVIDLC